jgi:hypothetical protein
LNKSTFAPRNRTASAKHAAPLHNLSSDLWGPLHVPSPHGLRYCLLVIDHLKNFMWVRFLMSKDETCSNLETILLDARIIHARESSPAGYLCPIHKKRLG